jgi:hypothetical protein
MSGALAEPAWEQWPVGRNNQFNLLLPQLRYDNIITSHRVKKSGGSKKQGSGFRDVTRLKYPWSNVGN